MVNCSCGKVIDKIPDWLRSAKVDYICNNCPNRQLKNIAFVDLAAGLKTSGKSIDGEIVPEVVDEDED